MPLGVRMINIDFHPLLGGAQMHTLRLCRYLRSQGVDVEVITRHHPGLAYEEEVDGIPVYRTPILNDSKAGASLSFQAYALKRLAATRKRFQIIHSHEMLSPMTIGLIAREVLGTKLVINPHRGGYLGDVYKLQKTRKGTGRLRLAWARRRGDAFISVSKEITSELKAAGLPAEKIHFLPYAMEMDHYRPLHAEARAALRQKLGMNDAPYAIYGGRLVPEKGLDVLLNAWTGVIQARPEAQLLIVGDGEERRHLENLTEQLGLTRHVQFTGAVPDTAPYFQASDVYVQPSFTEGLPIAMLEAMACSMAVIVTAVGGVGDLVHDGKNGVLISPKDANCLRTSLVEVLGNPNLRQTLGSKARQDVTAYCAIEHIGQAHIHLYQELIERRSRR